MAPLRPVVRKEPRRVGFARCRSGSPAGYNPRPDAEPGRAIQRRTGVAVRRLAAQCRGLALSEVASGAMPEDFTLYIGDLCHGFVRFVFAANKGNLIPLAVRMVVG